MMSLENSKVFTVGLKRIIEVVAILLFCSCVLFACKNQPKEGVIKKELLIYCGTTMAPAIREISNIFEQQENCIVKIIKDGSGSLYRGIHINQVGDLFLPGSESYIEKCQAEGTVVESQPVGVNRAVLLVAKGNPLRICSDLDNFINGKYRTVLGAPESGSIGRETRLILSMEGLYRKAVGQALFLATDSKDLENAIKESRADLTLNWYAAALRDKENAVDVVPLDELVAPPHVLALGLLKTSYHLELARRYIAFASSSTGQAILSRYGFGE